MTLSAHDLYEASSWANPDAVHALFQKMRLEAPVFYCEHPDYPAFWHITRHSDIFDIERKTDSFLNEPRQVINTTAREDSVRALTGGTLNIIRSLVTMDPPDHPKMRLLTQAWFMPKNLGQLQGRIDWSAGLGMQRLMDSGGTCDFAAEVALEFPLRVVMDVLGVPSSDYTTMLRLTQELFGPDDPDAQRKDVTPDENPAAAIERTFQELAAYFSALSDSRRALPRDDVASLIANAEIDGKPIDDASALGYYIIIATAGHDTTSYSLSEAVRQLASAPDLFLRLKSDPEAIAPKIAEEAIRLAAPVRHFVRTAKTDVDVAGQTIRAGESVILWYPSGSRDEDVFENPNHFDIDRATGVRHAAFGHGAHMCLGMHLARRENTTFLQTLANNVRTLDLAGAPKYSQSSFVSGIKSLPIHVTMEQPPSRSDISPPDIAP